MARPRLKLWYGHLPAHFLVILFHRDKKPGPREKGEREVLAMRVSQVILEIKEDEAGETHPHPTQHSWDQLHKAFNISAGHSALASWHT